MYRCERNIIIPNENTVPANEVMEALKISRTTLWRWEKAGLIPERLGWHNNTVYWEKKTLSSWMKKHKYLNNPFQG